MPSEPGGFTIREDDSYVRESLVIEAGLARALDEEPDEPFEQMMHVNVESVRERADHLAASEGLDAARHLLLHEAQRYTRWMRAIDLGLAGNDDEDRANFVAGMRGSLARVAVWAALYGLQAGMSPENLVSEVVAAGGLELGEAGRYVTAQFLVLCYQSEGRPDLGLSLLIRSPTGESAAERGEHLRSVLNTARRAYANGHVRRVAELLAVTDWTDATGLERELVRRLVTEREPSQAELAARADARRQAFETGDWVSLRELALFDVMWLEEDPNLWMALGAILKMNGAAEQAKLAQDVAELVAGEGSSR
jgi:hypothetical protein